MGSTVFIAVQCCQCSTMQVKQKKKSSNKWNCAVCNQKQSVRKVFAQGFLAKDIRTFVQSFNMSRKSLDEQSLFGGTLAPALDEEQIINDKTNLNLPVNQKNKRSDWTEYLDPEDHHMEKIGEQEQNGDDSETKVVTELEKGMFKKPRLGKYSTGLGSGGSDKLYKPLFSRRNINKKTIPQEEPMKDQQTLTSNSKWDSYMASDDQRPRSIQPSPTMGKTKATSKWNDYITEDDDDNMKHGWKRAFNDQTDQLNNSVLEAITNEQRVEDDIHPDFM